MTDCTKRNCPLVNPNKCTITTECPFYTNETIEKAEETIAGIVSKLILKIKHCDTTNVLQEIKNQIDEIQTYKLFIDGEKYINRDEVLKLIDEKIKKYVK